MDKNEIKIKLRESIDSYIEEAKKKKKKKKKGSKKEDEKSKEKKDSEERNEKNVRKDYSDIPNYFKKDLHIPMSRIMTKALGIEDDEGGINRSLFRKKVYQEKNDEGGLYQFDDDEIDRIRAVVKTN